MSKVNYHGIKDVDLKVMLEERGLELKEYNRQEAIEVLKIDDVTTGKGTEILVKGDDGLEEMPEEEEYVKVRFHNVRDGEAPYIFLGHNGKAYYVPKDEDIYIPKFLLDSCVKDAIETHADPVTKDGKIIMVPRQVQRFPYSIVPE